jgi:hypothetical protein
MKKKILFVVAILLYTQSIFAQDVPVKQQDVSPQQLQKQNKQIVQLAATELSKNLPQKVDKYTNIVKVKADNTNLVYIFEINTGAKSDEAIINEDHSKMQEVITQGVCRSSKRFLEAQITIVYKYISAVSKKELFKFKINQANCLNK